MYLRSRARGLPVCPAQGLPGGVRAPPLPARCTHGLSLVVTALTAPHPEGNQAAPPHASLRAPDHVLEVVTLTNIYRVSGSEGRAVSMQPAPVLRAPQGAQPLPRSLWAGAVGTAVAQEGKSVPQRSRAAGTAPGLEPGQDGSPPGAVGLSGAPAGQRPICKELGECLQEGTRLLLSLHLSTRLAVTAQSHRPPSRVTLSSVPPLCSLCPVRTPGV